MTSNTIGGACAKRRTRLRLQLVHKHVNAMSSLQQHMLFGVECSNDSRAQPRISGLKGLSS